MSLKFTKEHTIIAKAFAIILMFMHHLFAFPDRIKVGDYISLLPFIEIAGKNPEFHLGVFGKICVAMYLFLSGYGMGIVENRKDRFTFKDSLLKIRKIYVNYWLVFIVFIPIGFLLAEREFEMTEFTKNLIGISSSYNDEWWFFGLYVILILIFPISKKIVSDNLFFSLLRIGIIYALAVLAGPILKKFPDYLFIRKTFIYSLFHMIAFWQASFFMGYITFKFNLFEFVKGKFVHFNMDKKYVYTVMALSLIIARLGLRNLGIIFDFVIAPLFIFSISNIFYRTKLTKIFNVLEKHSTNMWLTHSFFCYHYFQKFIFSPKYSLLVVLILILSTIGTSILINKIMILKDEASIFKYLEETAE